MGEGTAHPGPEHTADMDLREPSHGEVGNMWGVATRHTGAGGVPEWVDWQLAVTLEGMKTYQQHGPQLPPRWGLQSPGQHHSLPGST